jgi:hypothetical protein
MFMRKILVWYSSEGKHTNWEKGLFKWATVMYFSSWEELNQALDSLMGGFG